MKSSRPDPDVALEGSASRHVVAGTLAHIGSQHRGDNLDILHRYLKDEATNLIHLEPPFNSIQNSNTFFNEGGCAEATDKLVEVRP